MPVNSDLTEAQVREFFTTLSNWGKWGPNDQFGALNYITPAKRAQAAALVREGVSVSMSLPLATQPSPDNPTPVTHLMIQTGAPGETEMVPLPYSADYFAISPHGIANTHLDALCHVFHQGKMYNGYSASDVTSEGARNGAIDALRDGIVSRGVLIDVPRVKAQARVGAPGFGLRMSGFSSVSPSPTGCTVMRWKSSAHRTTVRLVA